MIPVRLRVTLLGAASAALAACGAHTPTPLAASTRDFPLVLAEAQVAAAAGRYADADRSLAAFGRAFDGTGESAETIYWRALLRLDPANRESSAREAISLFDTYLKVAVPIAHRTDASTLRRLAAQRETMSRELEAAREIAARAAMPVPPVAPVRDTVEIQRLRDSLARTNAELERIKRRISAPRP